MEKKFLGTQEQNPNIQTCLTREASTCKFKALISEDSQRLQYIDCTK
jgi:hypothetical protein